MCGIPNNPTYVQEKRLFQYTTRFIDDLLSVNAPAFLAYCDVIYSPYLPLNQTNSSVSAADYVDFTIICSTTNSEIELYDKTSSINFDVIKFAAASSNIHSRIPYGTFFSQLIRIACICNNFHAFRKCVVHLFNTFCNKGFDRLILIRRFKLFCKEYMALILRVGLYNTQSVNQFIHDNF